MSYLLVFVTISLLVTLHELGHLLAAKWTGIPIARFSVGFGRKLWGFKPGQTEYWLAMIPLGGYVLPAVQDEDALERVPLRKRIVFSLGGPVANLVGAFLCLALMNTIRSGFSVNAVVFHPLEQSYHMAVQICLFIPTVFSRPDHLSSIVGIVAGGGAYVGLSLMKLLQFSVLLNVNLAIFNLLPILPLDGGKIMMGVLQKIHRPLRKLEWPLTVGGVVLMMALILYATMLDVARLV
jgi:regulator of sigma E protease